MNIRALTTVFLVFLGLVFITMASSCSRKAIKTEDALETGKVTRAPTRVVTTTKKEPVINEKTLSEEQRRIFMNQDIFFDFDRYDLKAETRDILNKKAEFLKTHSKVRLLIEGHCDERGTNEYNLALGERRAYSAKRYLVSLGIGSERISTVSYGEERPLDPRHAEDAWAKNRRCHFIISEP